MFLTVLTGTVVALALVAQATDFGQPFVVFALLLLPVVLFIGLTTFVRLGEVNEEDLVWVRGMNRIRRAYLDIDPEIEPIFITGSTDDLDGVMRTYGSHETPGLRETFTHALVTTPATIAFVDCVIAAVLVGLVAAQLGVGMEGSALAAVGGFAVLFAGIAVYSTRKGMDVWVEGKVANRERE
jgi:hypothetical protein